MKFIQYILGIVVASLFFTNGASGATLIIQPGEDPSEEVKAAAPGDTILLAPGTHSRLHIYDLVAAECDPTVIMNQDEDNPGYISTTHYFGTAGDAAIRLVGCEYLIIDGIQIVNNNGTASVATNTGIDIQFGHHIIVRNCDIQGVRNAGMKIRFRSSHIDVLNNVIHDTGNGDNPGYGEGIYLGTANAKNPIPWDVINGEVLDTCSHVWIEGNEIYDTGAGEGIDFKGDFEFVTVRNNYIHDLSLGYNGQTNEGAISVAGGRDGEPGEFWIESNTIENITYGVGTGARAAGICTFGGGHYILNNTIGNCADAAINFNGYYRNCCGLEPYFIYENGNTINNTIGDDYKGATGTLEPWIIKSAPGFTNPYEPQSWCGDVKNNCPLPDLGGAQSICGVGNIVLDAGHAPDGLVTYEWFKNGVPQGAPSTSAATFDISSGGTWSVTIDSAGICSNTSEVVISDVIEAIPLEDGELCEALTLELVAGVSHSGYNYAWKKEGQPIGETDHILSVSEAGVYEVTVSASGCSSVVHEATVTSALPLTTGDVICSAGAAFLVATGDGEIYWYDAVQDGTLLYSGGVYDPTIAQTTTYYVQSGETSVKYSLGHAEFNSSVDGGDYAGRKLKIVIDATLNIDSVTVNAKAAQTAHFRVLGSDNTTVIFDIENDVDAGIVQVPIGITLAPGTYYVDAVGSTGTLKMEDQNGGVSLDYAGYGVDGLISFTAEPSWEANWTNGNGVDVARWRYFYDWKVSVGASCVRVPVEAKIDPNDASCVIAGEAFAETTKSMIYPNPTSGAVFTDQEGPYEIMTAHGQILEVQDHLDFHQRQPGLYLVKFSDGSLQKVLKK